MFDFDDLVVDVSAVPRSPPRWVVDGLLPPGLTFLVGPPKSFKSTFLLEIAASVVDGRDIPGVAQATRPSRSVLYLAAEQSPGRLRHIYETVLGRRLENSSRRGLLLARDVGQWTIEEIPGMLAAFSPRPAVVALDPLAQFHTYDENDARFAHVLKPLRSDALRHNYALVVVHHLNKSKGEEGSTGPDWQRMRGTSALWGMADAGLLCSRQPSGRVRVDAQYKDHAEARWMWTPATGGQRPGEQPKPPAAHPIATARRAREDF